MDMVHDLLGKAEPVITGSMVIDGEASRGMAERHEYSHARKDLPLTFRPGSNIGDGCERETRSRACKDQGGKARHQQHEDNDENEQEEEGEEEEEEEENEGEESESDFEEDGDGIDKVGRGRWALSTGHFCIDRDHPSFDQEDRKDEQLKLVVGEPTTDDVRMVSGYSKTEHGLTNLVGFIIGSTSLFLYKAEDAVDQEFTSYAKDSKGRRKVAVKPRVKLTCKPRSSQWIFLNESLNLRPQHISGRNSTQNWTIAKIFLEFFANLMDEAYVRAREQAYGVTPILAHQTTRSKDGKKMVTTFFAKGTTCKLARITYKKTTTKWVASYTRGSTKFEPAAVVDPCFTWVLLFENFGSHMLPEHFLRGVSGAEKQDDPNCIGQFGDGLLSAFDHAVRRGINVKVTTAGFTTTAMQDKDGNTYTQHARNNQTEHRVTVGLTFPPKEPFYLSRYGEWLTDNIHDRFDPEDFVPMSTLLSPTADRVSVDVHGPASASSAILLEPKMRGKFFNRDIPVYDEGDDCLFGYSLADPSRNLIAGRDRSAMKPKLTRAAIDQLLCKGIEKSPRLRRKLVMHLTRGAESVHHVDIRVKRWTPRAVKLVQQESLAMFPGTVLAYLRTPLCTIVAMFRGQKIESCHHRFDEGKALVHDFVQEILCSPRRIIERNSPASGWMTMAIMEKLCGLTGAPTLASVKFSGKLQAKHVVWVEPDVVLVSERTLTTNLKQESVATAKFLLDLISCSMNREFSFETLSESAFEVYHLIMNAELPKTASISPEVAHHAPVAPERVRSGDRGEQGLHGEETTGPDETEAACDDHNAAAPASFAIEAEETKQDSADSDGGRPDMTAEECDEESVWVNRGGVEDCESEDSDRRSVRSGKRACDTSSEEETIKGQFATKRRRQSVSEWEGGLNGASPPILAQAETAPELEEVTRKAAVSVKVEDPRSSTPQPTPETALPQAFFEGLCLSHDAGEGKEENSSANKATGAAPVAAPAAPPVPARDGEELGAFLPKGGGNFVPALIHVERRAMCREARSVDLYRIAGRKGNGAELLTRVSAVMASECARRMLESAVKKPDVDLSLFCWDAPDALPAFIGEEAGRIFVNLFHGGSKTVDEWAEDDLPTHIAALMAHVRTSTTPNAHSHAWSVEFRKWVISQDL